MISMGIFGQACPHFAYSFLLASTKWASFALITSFNKLLLNCHRKSLELTLKYSMSLAPVSKCVNKLQKIFKQSH